MVQPRASPCSIAGGSARLEAIRLLCASRWRKKRRGNGAAKRWSISGIMGQEAFLANCVADRGVADLDSGAGGGLQADEQWLGWLVWRNSRLGCGRVEELSDQGKDRERGCSGWGHSAGRRGGTRLR